jgi:hypothetical protein
MSPNEWTYNGKSWVRTTRTHAVLVITNGPDHHTGGYRMPGTPTSFVDVVCSGSVATDVRNELEQWAAKFGIIDVDDITAHHVRLPE